MKRLIVSAIAGVCFGSGSGHAGDTASAAQGRKILVVYYSKTGNTERVAKDVASSLNADIEKVIDRKNRSGFIAFFTSGHDAMKKRLTEIAPLQKDPANYDLVVVGTPVWGWNITPAIRTFLEENKSKLKNIAYIVIAGGTPVEKIIPSCNAITGKQPVASVGFVTKDLKDENIYKGKVGKFVGELKIYTEKSTH